MKTERRYSYKDVEMLITARTLCKNFENHKAEIITLHLPQTIKSKPSKIRRFTSKRGLFVGVLEVE